MRILVSKKPQARPLNEQTKKLLNKREKIRQEAVPAHQLKEDGDQLYSKVVAKIKKDFKDGRSISALDCKIRPNCVFGYVIKKLESKGWKAVHSYNDHEVGCDVIQCSPPDSIFEVLEAE